MVVHGQIMLNQFRHYHIKAVANSAFVSSLKAKMEQRRHCKLYSAPKVGSSKPSFLCKIFSFGDPATYLSYGFLG